MEEEQEFELQELLDLQVIHDQVSKNRVRGTKLLELLEDQSDHATGLLVRPLNDLSRGCLEISQGNGQEQLAALRLVPTSTKQAISQVTSSYSLIAPFIPRSKRSLLSKGS